MPNSLSKAFSFLITPAFGGIFILFFIGIAFMLYGIFRMILAFKWRKFNKEIKDSEEEIIEVEIIE